VRTSGYVILWSISTACFLAGAPRPKDDRTPEPPPDGEWAVEKEELSGSVVKSKPKGRPDRIQWTVRLSPTKWEVFRSGSERPLEDWPAAYFKTAAGNEVDFFPDEPKFLRKGIWKLDGDTLLVCYADVGGDRPTEFTSPKDSKQVLYTLKRRGKD
jgi:uncharacterized protein (TIGR03067 family)